MKKINKFIFGIILGAIITAGVGYSASILYNSDEVGYDNQSSGMTSTNVQDAIDELYSIAQNKECKNGYEKNTTTETSSSYECEKAKICKRATTLHTATCSITSGGCYEAGYYSGGSKDTTTITYGNLGTGETLTPGDAFDCDVNADGTYDAATERFYYVTSSGDNAVFIYYTNVTGGTTATQNNYAYYASAQENWHGPVTAAAQLPSTTQWSNSQIIAPGTRQITTETGTTSTSGGSLPNFEYTGKAARLLTTQELVAGCSSLSSVGSSRTGELDGCNYLMENVGQYETTSGTYGYWLESPRASYSGPVWNVNGSGRCVGSNDANNAWLALHGVRPAITVLKSNISY